MGAAAALDTSLDFLESGGPDAPAYPYSTSKDGVRTPRLVKNQENGLYQHRTVIPIWEARINRTLKMIEGIYTGSLRARADLAETMSTSDFPVLFGDITTREMLGMYDELPSTWSNYFRRSRLVDFRAVKRFTVDGMEAPLDQVRELTEYPHGKVTEAQVQYALKKWGRQTGFSWETVLNNDLNMLEQFPLKLARAARRTEQKVATLLMFGINGPNGAVFTAGNENILQANANFGTAINAPLSFEAIEAAITQLSSQRDPEGNPIMYTALDLVVPPALEPIANRIVNMIEVRLKEAGGTANAEILIRNTLASRLRVNVDPWLPVVATTANGNTTWALVARSDSGRPFGEMGFLASEPGPALFIKSPNAIRVGGGAADPMDGDFELDAVDYKVRHVANGVILNPKAAVASNGTGV